VYDVLECSKVKPTVLLHAGGGAASFVGTTGANYAIISASSFQHNSAPNGGAINLEDQAVVSITAGSRLAGNHATSSGGAMHLQGTARLQLSNSSVLENNTGAALTDIHID
jgi:hypothetical protein